jgi:hypothetical protein
MGFSPLLPENATWSASAGSISPTFCKQPGFTAPSNAANNVTVTATVGNRTVTFPPFNVVAPTGVTGTLYSSNSYPTGTQGVGMTIKITCQPTNVSFYRVAILELPGPATNVSGCFTNTNLFADLSHYPTSAWSPLSQGNQTTDSAYFNSIPAPWSLGEFDWNIPWAWQILGSSATNIFTDVLQQNIINSTNGTSTIKKLGVTITRTP